MYAILMLLNYTICNAFCNFRDYYKSYISISTIYIYAKTNNGIVCIICYFLLGILI